MTCSISRLITALISLTALTQVDALAEVPNLRFDIAYSAIRTIDTEDQRISQRYYQQNAMVHRMETEIGGQQSIVIMRGDRELMWTVMPAQRMVMEFSMLDAATQLSGIPDLPEENHWGSAQSVGRESVNGVATTRWVVRSAPGDGGEGTLWVSDEGILMRMEMYDNRGYTRMELSELVVGPQASTLFEPPAGYQHIAPGGAGGLFGSLPGQGRSAGPAGASPRRAADTDAEGTENQPPGLLDGLAEEAAAEARKAAEEESRRGVREEVRKGIRGLFGR